MTRPDLLTKDINKLTSHDIQVLLSIDPTEIERLLPIIHKLNSHSMFIVLSEHPTLIRYFKDKNILDTIDDHWLRVLLGYRPYLIRDFKEVLIKRNWKINYYPYNLPKLNLCFKYLKTEYFMVSYYLTFPEAYESLSKEQQQLVNEQIAKFIEKEVANSS